ncbi:N-6 DNA methylase domain protein, partial [mine drainage metagenome]
MFIDARKLGTMVDRTHRELTDADLAKIAGTYHAWRGDSPESRHSGGACPGMLEAGGRDPAAKESRHSRESGNPVSYEDIPGFCKSATLDDIRKHGHV